MFQKILLKIIKDKDYSKQEVRVKYGLFVSVIGVFINLSLFLIKLIIGLIVLSNAIISDAFNNLSDLFSCFINLFSFKVARKPADKDHPYGHERIEYIAGMIISFIIIVIAIFIGYEAIVNLINKKNDLKFSYITFIILLISIIFKILLGLFYFKISKTINSVSLKAAMFDSFNDVFSTLVVLISYLIQFIFKDLWFIDNSMSLIVAIFILYNGMKMLKESGSFLLGEKINKETLSNIKNDVLSFEGILGIHNLRAHSYGPTNLFLTFDVEVDGSKNAFEIHELIDNIEKFIEEKYKAEAVIHMDPLDIDSKEINNISNNLNIYLKKYNLDFHDLRFNYKNSEVKFEISIPFYFKEEDKIKEELDIYLKDIYQDKYIFNYTFLKIYQEV